MNAAFAIRDKHGPHIIQSPSQKKLGQEILDAARIIKDVNESKTAMTDRANRLLLSSAERGSVWGMRAALKHGAEIKHVDEAGRSALMLASYSKKEEAVRFILETMQEMKMTGPEIISYVNQRGGALSKSTALGHANTITGRNDPTYRNIISVLQGFEARM